MASNKRSVPSSYDMEHYLGYNMRDVHNFVMLPHDGSAPPATPRLQARLCEDHDIEMEAMTLPPPYTPYPERGRQSRTSSVYSTDGCAHGEDRPLRSVRDRTPTPGPTAARVHGPRYTLDDLIGDSDDDTPTHSTLSSREPDPVAIDPSVSSHHRESTEYCSSIGTCSFIRARSQPVNGLYPQSGTPASSSSSGSWHTFSPSHSDSVNSVTVVDADDVAIETNTMHIRHMQAMQRAMLRPEAWQSTDQITLIGEVRVPRRDYRRLHRQRTHIMQEQFSSDHLTINSRRDGPDFASVARPVTMPRPQLKRQYCGLANWSRARWIKVTLFILFIGLTFAGPKLADLAGFGVHDDIAHGINV